MADDAQEIVEKLSEFRRRWTEGGSFAELPAALAEAAALIASQADEIDRYRSAYGRLCCGEDHGDATLCPPHEVRTTGIAWFDARMRAAVARSETAEAALAEAVAKRATAVLVEREACAMTARRAHPASRLAHEIAKAIRARTLTEKETSRDAG